MYALICNKNEQSYTDILHVLKEKEPRLNPKNIMIDFEKSLLNASVAEFPNAMVNGCFFHYCQSIWRNIQKFGLQDIYASNPNFALNIKMLMALAFVEEEEVIDSFEEMLKFEFFVDESFPEKSELRNLLTYYEKTWIGSKQINGSRKRPLFPISMWNVRDLTLNGKARTNNAVEGWHNTLLKFIGCQHPSIYKFIENIKREQNLQEIRMSHLRCGILKDESRKKYKSHDARLVRLIKNNDFSDIHEFLLSISENLNF